MKSVIAASTIAVAAAQHKGSLTVENHPHLAWEDCTASGCTQQSGKVVIDANWRWTHKKGQTTNCYDNGKWDASLCPDVQTCTQNCVVEGADAEYEAAYGVHASGSELQLDFVTKGQYNTNVGSRTFLMEDDYAYKLFQLKNREFTYTVDDSKLDCGLNGALYFVQMDADGGKAKYGNAGAEMGLGYCDAQCPHDLKFINGEANMDGWTSTGGKYGSCCTEIDIWEANKQATAVTMHSCEGGSQTRCEGQKCGDTASGDQLNGICDKSGCDIQAHRLGVHNFFGPGSEFQIDSTKPVTVTTQFITADGTDHGKLTEVKQFYQQDGKVVQHPEYTVNGKTHNTISDDYCADWDAETKDGTIFLERGGMDNVEKAIDAGVVLVMSLWDDHATNMLWLDSTYPVDSTDPGAVRGFCSSDSGKPDDVEIEQADARVIFSDIKFGPLGTTTPTPVPPPPPSPPSPPSPSPSGDCPGGSMSACMAACSVVTGDAYDICISVCKENCPATTTPAPAPSPSPGGCPGGSLSACINGCPTNPAIFASCVAHCEEECAPTTTAAPTPAGMCCWQDCETTSTCLPSDACSTDEDSCLNCSGIWCPSKTFFDNVV